MIDLAAIRARDACVRFMDYATAGDADRRLLLEAYDRLAAAARKVTCSMCLGQGTRWDVGESALVQCDRCTDLRIELEGGGK